MKQTINKSEFTAAFHQMDRGDNFSHAGLLALYHYLVDLEEETGEEMDLDVIALCCEFSEYDLEELQQEFGDSDDPWESMEEATDWLEDRTTVIHVGDDSVIIQDF